MTMRGTTCGFDSRCPTNEELHDDLRWFCLSDEHYWDPTEVSFPSFGNTSSVVGAIHTDMRFIKSVDHNTPGLIHECDRLMASVSTELIPDTLAHDLITSVNVDSSFIGATYSGKRHHGTDPILMARKWGIGLDTAKKTLGCTTQLNIRSAILPLTCRYRTDLLSQRLKRLSCRFYTDAAHAKFKSHTGNTYAQIFTDGEGFVVAFPIRTKDEAGESLQRLCRDVGIPNELHSDNANEMTAPGTKFQQIVKDNKIKHTSIEPHSPWQNRCENIIGVIGKKAKARRARRRVPAKFWDYGLVWECEIYSRTARGTGDRTGIERLTGDSIDISDWVDFEFYDLVWYWDTRDVEDKKSIGRWLGVAHNIGSALCYWIATDKGTILARTTVQHLTVDEIKDPEVIDLVQEYHISLDKSLGSDQYDIDQSIDDFVHDDISAPIGSGYEEGEYFGLEESKELDEVVDNSDERLLADTYDRYLGAEVAMHDRKGEKLMAKVMRKTHSNDNNANEGNYNYLNDHLMYEVQFSNGNTEELSANVIAENMLSSCDSEGNHFQLIKEIMDHKRDGSAIGISDGYIISKNGNKTPKMTTRGWKLLVEWKDGSMDWVNLKDLKQSNPVELAEYALANGIEEEPAFKWWVRHTLRKRDRIISKVKSKYWRTSHKFGIRIPKTVEEALEIDRITGTDFWTKAIEKEMKNVRIAFAKLD